MSKIDGNPVLDYLDLKSGKKSISIKDIKFRHLVNVIFIVLGGIFFYLLPSKLDVYFGFICSILVMVLICIMPHFIKISGILTWLLSILIGIIFCIIMQYNIITFFFFLILLNPLLPTSVLYLNFATCRKYHKLFISGVVSFIISLLLLIILGYQNFVLLLIPSFLITLLVIFLNGLIFTKVNNNIQSLKFMNIDARKSGYISYYIIFTILVIYLSHLMWLLKFLDRKIFK